MESIEVMNLSFTKLNVEKYHKSFIGIYNFMMKPVFPLNLQKRDFLQFSRSSIKTSLKIFQLEGSLFILGGGGGGPLGG